MAEFQVDHVHLRSIDPETMAAFFIEMFGAATDTRMQTPAGLRIILDLSGLKLFIEKVPEGTAAAPAMPHLGLEHIGLTVKGIDAAVAELRQKNAVFLVEPMSPRPGIKICYLAGPDGVIVEILERETVS